MTKKKRLSPSEWLLKQSKRHKRKKYTLHGNCTFSSVSSTHICC